MSMVSEVPAVSKVPWPWVPTVSDVSTVSEAYCIYSI